MNIHNYNCSAMVTSHDTSSSSSCTIRTRVYRSCYYRDTAVPQPRTRLELTAASITVARMVHTLGLVCVMAAVLMMSMIPNAHAVPIEDDCERLSDQSLHYTQEKAPRDLSGLVCVVFVFSIIFFVVVVVMGTYSFMDTFSAASFGCETNQPSLAGRGGRGSGVAWW